MTRRIVENLVIGGGPAGSMAALRLAQAGCEVTLIERERGPHHKVCGEFLSGEAVEYLGQIGIDPRALDAAPIERVRLSVGRRTVEAELPFSALSLSRKILDEAMLVRAGESGVELLRSFEVESLSRDGALWRVEIRGGETLWARTAFLATGKHDVRGWSRGEGKQSDLVGFKMHWKLRRAQIETLRGAMQLYLFPGGYGGMALVEGDVADFCFVIRRCSLQSAGGWAKVVGQIRESNQTVDELLDGAEMLYERPLAIAPIPYGYLAGPEPGMEQGVWRIGDQAAVIPSFTGDGMSIALHSATLAAAMHLDGKSADEFSRVLRSQLSRGMRLATALSQAMTTSLGRGMTPIALATIPHAMRWIAAATRIPERALAANLASLRRTHPA